jgi:hypothetical protein
MLPCLPAFALRPYNEVTAGREVFEECYGKFTMHFAHHCVPNVEVSRWFEDDSAGVEFGRPKENISLMHPDDPKNVWCVARAGHEITVVYDKGKGSVTFLNMRGIFSLRNVGPELASWAQAAEHVMPVTGRAMLCNLSDAIYPPVARVVPGQRDRPLDYDDKEYELVLEHGAGGDFDGDVCLDAKADSAIGKSHAPGSSSVHTPSQTTQQPITNFLNKDHILDHILFEPRPIASAHASTDSQSRFQSFSIEMAKANHDHNLSNVYQPKRDGTFDQELLELQLHDTMVKVVKVLRAAHAHISCA